MRIFFCLDGDVAGPCDHFAVDLCIGSGHDRDITRICINAGVFIIDSCFRSRRHGNIAVSGYYRTVHDGALSCFQLYVASRIRAAVDRIVICICKPDCARFQITLAVRNEFTGQFHQPQPHRRILPACAVDTPHIRIFG